MKNFGIKLKELRLKKGESQKKLAEILNVSFQTISKWEQGIHFPDVFIIELIAKHYNVDYNYLFDNEDNNIKTESYVLATSINKKDIITTWTDFEYQNSIAPKAELDENRHCAGNRSLKTHPGPKEYLIIAIDENHQICFMAEHRNNIIPICGPNGEFYSQTNGTGKNNPCFIVQDTYKVDYKLLCEEHEKDFEFVIPKKGFLINIPFYNIETKELLLFLLPSHLKRKIEKRFSDGRSMRNTYFNNLFNGVLLTNELNNISVYLNDSKVIFEKTVIEEKSNQTENQQLKDLIDELEERIDMLESRIEELEEIDIESKLDDLDSRIDDIDSRIGDIDN